MYHLVQKILIILIVLLVIITGVFYLLNYRYETSVEKASACMEKGKYDEAAALYDSAHKVKKKEIEPILGLAKAYYIKNELDRALELYLEARKLKPDSYDIAVSLANVCMAKGESDQAEQLYLEALEMDNTDAEPYLQLADIYLQRNEIEKLTAIVDKAKRNVKTGFDSLQEMDNKVIFRLADYYYERNDEANAEFFYREAIKIDPAYQEGYINLAQICINKDEVLEAVNILKKGEKTVQGTDISNMLDTLLKQPDMPKADVEPGYYNEEKQITLIAESPEHSIYYTTNGREPDWSSTLYTGPITLPDGVTTIKAISVSKAMVESDVAEYKYEIEIPIPVNFTDRALESRVRELLGKYNKPVTHIDLKQIRQLIIIGDQVLTMDKIVLDENGRPVGYYNKKSRYTPWDECETTGEIRSLKDLEWFKNLELLDIRFNRLNEADYALEYGAKYPIAVTFKDKELEKYIRELIQKPKGFILSRDLHSIKQIRIVGNTLVTEDRVHYTSKGAYSYYGADGKEYSWHEYDKRGSISTLEDMIWFTGLEDLYIRFNNLKSLDGIEYLKNLEYLDFGYNYINDIDALEHLQSMINSVELCSNRIEDISVFQRMDPYAVKVVIGLANNRIRDISPLKSIVLENIYLDRNPIQNGKTIIQEMKNRGIKVYE